MEVSGSSKDPRRCQVPSNDPSISLIWWGLLHIYNFIYNPPRNLLCNHLKKLCDQISREQKLHLNIDLSKYNQRDGIVQDRYSGFRALRTEKDLMLLQSIPKESLSEVLLSRKNHILVNFYWTFIQILGFCRKALVKLLQTWSPGHFVFRKPREENCVFSIKQLWPSNLRKLRNLRKIRRWFRTQFLCQ